MQAVIVAAGLGRRLRPLTNDRPKALLEVGGKSLITRSVENILDRDISDIAVVVGYQKEMIVEHLRGHPVTFIYNPFYKITNNMASLWFAQGFVKEDFVYLHSDVILDLGLFRRLVDDATPNALLVEKKPCGAEEMKVKVQGTKFVASSMEIPLTETFGEWTGLAKFSASFGETLFARFGQLIEQGHLKAYDTVAFTELAREGAEIEIVDFAGQPWVDIDFLEDFEKARNLFKV